MDRLRRQRAKLKPTKFAMAGRPLPLVSWGAGRRLELDKTFSMPPLAWSRGGDVRRFSLRYSCSEQRVHSGLYDGVTWPDTGFASLD
ncbi:hypothetical protein [Pseudorhodoplanes sinuspersici]|uniref:Uncharacterized protein n=1 Tax=Pseudorhodoplanes sinuspersici TaxID=1235591 RepID=A0A1W6ZL90_9HYPH|nr:hypothetical protein [Pseudorhodoplanes sinuspersici]ARP98082.1 hypothetical protein CAK95_02540 [Pseudorhodoplanes sinuspersici]RKE68165.1 hypothetical protein DFP91_4530 [Pseudorhodoplanes sinuspersici]